MGKFTCLRIQLYWLLLVYKQIMVVYKNIPSRSRLNGETEIGEKWIALPDKVIGILREENWTSGLKGRKWSKKHDKRKVCQIVSGWILRREMANKKSYMVGEF